MFTWKLSLLWPSKFLFKHHLQLLLLLLFRYVHCDRLSPPYPPSPTLNPNYQLHKQLVCKLQNIRASLTAWSSAPTRSTSCFLFYFDSSCFLCLVSRLTSPSDSLGALPSAVSSPVTLPSLSCMYLFSHSPIVPHACLFPCTAFPEFSTIPTISCPVYVFFCKLSTLNLHFLVSLVLHFDPHSFCLDSQHQPFPTVPLNPQIPLQFVISQLYNVTGYMKEAAATQKIHVVINDSCGWSK